MSIINNALSGSLAAQAAINTTSQNIANLQTKGYTRQGVLLSAVAPSTGSGGPGFGVEVSKLIRFSDSYKSQQLWRANSELGSRTQSQPYFTQLERVMGNEQTSLSNGVDQFFRALNAAGVDPVSTPLRQQVLTAANAMAQSFNSIYNVTRQQQVSISQQRDAMLPQLNTLSANIAALNQRITQAGSLGTNTSALVDERDRAIDALANLVSVEVLEQPDGTRSVSLRSGQPLVVGNLAGTLSMNTSTTPASLELKFAGTTFGLDDTKVGGQLGGIGDFEKNTLQPLQQSLLDMADQLATKVNTTLAAGYKPDGLPGPPPTSGSPGTALFSFNRRRRHPGTGARRPGLRPGVLFRRHPGRQQEPAGPGRHQGPADHPDFDRHGADRRCRHPTGRQAGHRQRPEPVAAGDRLHHPPAIGRRLGRNQLRQQGRRSNQPGRVPEYVPGEHESDRRCQ
jgi:flagellar hook-associated protein 1 FlgK